MLTRAQQARYRPLVHRSWLAHCDLTGTAPNNQQARDDWYRDILWSSCRIRSTRQASQREFKILIKRFTLLSQAGDSVEVQGFTDGQNPVFAQLVDKAWQAVCGRSATRLPFHAWLDSELESCGIIGRRARDHVEQFEEVMSHFAVIAGDTFWIERTAEASERRMRHLIELKMQELGEIEGEPVDWQYCRSIYSHMHLPRTMDEANAGWLWKIFQALDTHIRRLRKQKESACPF